MMLRRRHLIGAAALAALPTQAAAPIRLVVAFAAGGAGDSVARIVAKRLSEGLGQTVIIDNRPIPVAAVTAVAQARPDGQTMLMAGSGTALTSALYAKLPYDLLADFAYVSTLASFELLVLVDGASRWQSVAELLAHARARPGKLTIASARVGSTQNLAAEMLRAMAGIEATIVPFRSAGEIVSALRGGDVDLALELLPAMQGQLANGTLRALAVGSAVRHGSLPTLAESGLPGFEASSWNGIVVPAGTPPALVTRLNREIGKVLDMPDVQKELRALGAVPGASTPQQMQERMRADIARWRGVIDKAGIPRQ